MRARLFPYILYTVSIQEKNVETTSCKMSSCIHSRINRGRDINRTSSFSLSLSLYIKPGGISCVITLSRPEKGEKGDTRAMERTKSAKGCVAAFSSFFF